MKSLDALERLYRTVVSGDRPTEREVIKWYRAVVIAECTQLKEAAFVLGVAPSTIYRNVRK